MQDHNQWPMSFATLEPLELQLTFMGVLAGYHGKPAASLPHRSGVSTYTSHCCLAGTCVVARQSPPSTPCGYRTEVRELPFSKSYGVILPSSLALITL